MENSDSVLDYTCFYEFTLLRPLVSVEAWTSVLSGLPKAPGLISTNITDMTEPTFILEKWNLALPAIGEVSTILVASHTNQVI